MKLISACLAGVNCKYNGQSNLDVKAALLVASGKAIPICPELLGGLSSPRNPCEMRHSQGQIKVVDEAGNDYTEAFQLGAEKTLEICRILDISHVILQDRSPSCGKNKVYSGNFDGELVQGNGLTASLLMANGITVASRDVLIDFKGCQIREIGQEEAEAIVHWFYPEPYKCYNMNGADIAVAEILAGDYYSVTKDDELFGFYCYGHSARIPVIEGKGHYQAEGYLDIGLGLRPDLCGFGRGADFMSLGLDYARRTKGAKDFRLSVASFNAKAIRLYDNLGFTQVSEFTRDSDQQKFMVMTKRLGLK